MAARTPTLSDVLERAQALVPRLRERARATEELRRLPDETRQDFVSAGLFRVLQPARYGGYELDYGRTQIELGQACGSSAWVQSVLACHAWGLGMFAPVAQDAVWGDDSDTLTASSFAPRTGRGRAVDGGYWVEGDWQFSSGSDLCSWIILGTPIADEARTVWALVPRSDWEVVDVWYAAGLRGSASNDIHVPGVFVPEAFTLDTGLCDGRPTPALLARSTRDTSYAVKLCVAAVERLVVAVGAHGMLDDTPIQRAARDVHAVASHAANAFDTAGVPWARFALGLGG